MKSEELPKERTNGNKPASDMTMREVIATEAMLGILASRELQMCLIHDQKHDGTTNENYIAAYAVKQADELLKQLEHGSK